MAESASPREVQERAAVLLAALERYRAGLARDGGEIERGTARGTERGREGAAECLLGRAAEIEALAGRQRRRIELLERATREEWMERPLAEEAYDLAREEGLEPAFGLELVRCGIAVCEPPDSELSETVAVEDHPEWLEPPVPGPAATRERRLRMSFRRLRRLLEERPTTEEALTAFAGEPDVRECEY